MTPSTSDQLLALDVAYRSPYLATLAAYLLTLAQ